MTEYELVNPSDEIYFCACDDTIAFVCSLLMGQGYGAKRVDGAEFGHCFYLFGISEEAFEKEVGMPWKVFLEERRMDIATALQTFRYARERTSLNKIVDYAHGMAKRMCGRGGV